MTAWFLQLPRVRGLSTIVLAAAIAAAVATAAGGQSVAEKLTPKQIVDNARAATLFANGRYTGTRPSTGDSLDATFCANGKWRSQVGDGSSFGKKWYVRNARFTANGFTAVVGEYELRERGGFSIAIAKRGAKWYFGIARGFDEATALGRVLRRGAKLGPVCTAG